jgi:hypothetical protein
VTVATSKFPSLHPELNIFVFIYTYIWA